MGIMEEEEVSRSEVLMVMVMVMVMVAIGDSSVPFRLNSVLSQSHVSAECSADNEEIGGLRPQGMNLNMA
jgi:hypothetical protein